jgi:hypothetical protein
MQSTDMNTRDASEKISEMTNINDITIFIAGDERKTVIDAADKKIAELRGPKQGEQADPITRPAADFKDGIQATKDAGSPLNPGTLESLNPRSYVTCEDVLKRLRAKGVKI